MYFKNINSNNLKKLLDKDNDLLLLDVRTKEEYEDKNIKGSVNIPLSDLMYDIEDYEEYKDKTVVVYCRSGHRSITTCNFLAMQGFKHLYNLEKGIIDYIK